MNALPETIESGYPPKLYRWTREWSEQTLGSRQVAMRNRRIVFYPIYRSDDGDIICPAWLQKPGPKRSSVH